MRLYFRGHFFDSQKDYPNNSSSMGASSFSQKEYNDQGKSRNQKAPSTQPHDLAEIENQAFTVLRV